MLVSLKLNTNLLVNFTLPHTQSFNPLRMPRMRRALGSSSGFGPVDLAQQSCHCQFLQAGNLRISPRANPSRLIRGNISGIGI
jgi:hypothetical protein